MKHVNEIRFEGKTPWIKAMNKANEYYVNSMDERLTEAERSLNHDLWFDTKFDIEMGVYGNNSESGGGTWV